MSAEGGLILQREEMAQESLPQEKLKARLDSTPSCWPTLQVCFLCRVKCPLSGRHGQKNSQPHCSSKFIARGRASSHMLMVYGAGTDEQMSNSANGAKTVAQQLEEQQRSVEVLLHGHLHGHQMLRRISYCLPSIDDIVSWIATGGRSKGTGKIEGPRAEEARVHGQGVWTKRWAVLCTPALLFCPTCCGDFDYCFFIGLPGHHCRLVPSLLRSWSFKIEFMPILYVSRFRELSLV